MNSFLRGYKNKLIALLAGCVLFLLICYLWGFRKTIDLYREYRQVNTLMGQAENLPEEELRSEQRLLEINERLSKYLADTLKAKERLLDIANGWCQKYQVRLYQLPASSMEEKDQVTMMTSTMELEGNYAGLLQFLHRMEREEEAGRISSAAFYSRTEPQTRKRKLRLKLYIQTIILKGDEHERNREI
jgi:hypothetical protein